MQKKVNNSISRELLENDIPPVPFISKELQSNIATVKLCLLERG